MPGSARSAVVVSRGFGTSCLAAGPGRVPTTIRRHGPSRSRVGPVAAAVVVSITLAGCGKGFAGLDAQASDTWHRTYTLSPSGELRITNTNGSIEVEGVPGTTVEVSADRIANAATEAIARDVLPRVTIKESVAPDSVALETERISGIVVGVAYQVKYHVKAPRSASLRLTTANGSLTVNHVDGRVTALSVNGTFRGAALGGAVNARSVNGTIDAQLASVQESVALTTVNGTVRLAIPAEAKATVTATWVNGTLNTSGLQFDVAEQSRRRFEGRLNGGGVPIDLRTTNGRIRVEAAGGNGEGAPNRAGS